MTKLPPSLADRLGARCPLLALTASESAAYILGRLALCGATSPLFDPPALAALYREADGLPRRLNRLADLALLIAFARDRSVVDAECVNLAAREAAFDPPHEGQPDDGRGGGNMQRDRQPVGREVEGEAVASRVRSPHRVIGSLDGNHAGRRRDEHRGRQRGGIGRDTPHAPQARHEHQRVRIDGRRARGQQHGRGHRVDGERRMMRGSGRRRPTSRRTRRRPEQ